MKYEKSCGAVVVKGRGRNRRYLIIHQIQGHWGFPKGHMKENETEEQTAVREIHEETGLKTAIQKGFRAVTVYSPSYDVKKEAVYFLAFPAGGKEKVQKKELLEMRWVSFCEAAGVITYDSDAAVLKKASGWLEKREQDEIDSEKQQ